MSGGLTDAWYRGHPLLVLLWPLSALFWLVSSTRRQAYRLGLLRQERVGVPVVVVGNLNVGGSGKTPLVLWLAERMRARGYRPGIVSRGYGGHAPYYPFPVKSDSEPAQVGDEPCLLARRSGVPVVVDPKRPRGARYLVEHCGCDLVLCDDGLQHYALARDLEIVVVDGEREFGNGWLIPAGPMRETVGRLKTVDFVVSNGASSALPTAMVMTLTPGDLRRVRDDAPGPGLNNLREHAVHAVAGIGNPGRFFASLRASGLNIVEHAFPDHHAFRVDDLQFQPTAPLLMTEKDAMKCRDLVSDEAYYLPVTAVLHHDLAAAVDERLHASGVRDGQETA